MGIKIIAVFNLAFMLSINLAPLMGTDVCQISEMKVKHNACCEMTGQCTCHMKMNECKKTPIIPLITAPVNKITAQVDCEHFLSSNHDDNFSNDQEFYTSLIHYILPKPPPTHTSPLLI